MSKVQNYSQALENVGLAEKYLDGGRGKFIFTLFYFYSSLTELAVYFDKSEPEKTDILNRVAIHKEKIAYWANYAPANYQHKLNLVEAQRYRVLGEKSQAIEFYDLAIQGAKENKYIQDQALANELAAKFYLAWGKEKIARVYMQEAYDCYDAWGATAKTRQLEELYPHLLDAIEHSTHSKLLGDLNSYSSSARSDSLDLKTILQASQTISTPIEQEQLLSNLLQVVVENAGADRGCLLLKPKQQLERLAEWRNGVACIYEGDLPELSLFLPISLIYRVQRTLTATIVNNLQQEISALIADPYFKTHSPKSLLCLPILHQGNAIAFLYLENHLTIDAFTRDRLEVLHLLAAQAAISLHNAQLYQQLQNYSHTLEIEVSQRTADLQKANQKLHQLAMLDGLTGIGNRRRFDEYLQQEWRRLQREEKPLSLILCDVDFFKLYNDYYGHQAGDECLKQVAQAISRGIKRSSDFVARYGGEEFAIILPNTSIEGAIQISKAISEEVAQLQLPHVSSSVSCYVTLSLGIGSVIPTPESCPEILIATADRALYQAKTEGRNRYCCKIYENC
ncbi:diguanylate cyclase domain-containing protein [Merismopedia glauca]|uniref:diguanylate cyclase domain-containing protein n=1 Tax=Merismopedia glauca TaxID=292586 RepID=UPI0015E636D1|nr:diguanylate cyclase [Merismopedia glauca]